MDENNKAGENIQNFHSSADKENADMKNRLLIANNLPEMNYHSLICVNTSRQEFVLLNTSMPLWFKIDEYTARRFNIFLRRICQLIFTLRSLRISVNLWLAYPNSRSAIQTLI